MSPFEFILKQCSTNEQREALVRIQEAILKYENVRDFPNTRRIKYGQIKSKPFAQIVHKKEWENPKLILKLPLIKQDTGELSEQDKKSYGLEISREGTPNSRVKIYQSSKLKYERPINIFDLLQKLVGNKPSEPDAIYQELIDLALKVNLG